MFVCAVGDCVALTLGERIAHLNLSRNSFNPQVDLLMYACRRIFLHVAMMLSAGWEHRMLSLHVWGGKKLQIFIFLGTYSVTLVSGSATVAAFFVLNGPLVWVVSTFWGFIVCMSEVRSFCLLKYDPRRSSVNRQRGGCTSELSKPLPRGRSWCCSHSNRSPPFNCFN